MSYHHILDLILDREIKTVNLKIRILILQNNKNMKNKLQSIIRERNKKLTLDCSNNGISRQYAGSVAFVIAGQSPRILKLLTTAPGLHCPS